MSREACLEKPNSKTGKSQCISQLTMNFCLLWIMLLFCRLKSIIEVIILCGRQNIALRGHDESSGRFNIDAVENDGNFRSLLRMKCRAGDESLMKHLQNCPLNASYISPTVQNELITACGKIITVSIVFYDFT